MFEYFCVGLFRLRTSMKIQDKPDVLNGPNIGNWSWSWIQAFEDVADINRTILIIPTL